MKARVCALLSRGFSTGSSLAAIKKLRDLSGAPIGDVKKALEETSYDFDLAYDALRLKGLAAAAKKASRAATEGLVGIASTAQRAAVVEFVNLAAQSILSSSPQTDTVDLSSEAFLNIELPSVHSTIGEYAQQLSGTIREKIHIRRAFSLTTSGQIFTYCHNAPPGDLSGLGKIACVAAIETSDGSPLTNHEIRSLHDHHLGQQLAMHIAGTKPLYLDKTSVDPSHLQHETDLLKQQALDSGKPANIVEKIVNGRLHRFYEEFCLLQQKFVMDETTTVEKLLQKFSKEHKLPTALTISAFLRVQCGEGLAQ